MIGGRNVLITGAAGFLGRALALARVAAGDHVTCMVRDRTRSAWHGLPGVVVYGDVRDADFCRRTIADYEIDTIYHLAAQSIVSVCAEDPVTALDVGVMGTARLLTAARDCGRPVRVICMTSDKCYGSSPSPYTERTPLDARHAYEVSKACQDLVARMFFSNYGLDVRVVRAVNIYGPGDPNESRLIPKTIARCMAGESPVIHDGAMGMLRQYVYIDDMVAALGFIAARDRPPCDPFDKGAAPAFCVGSPDAPMAVIDVVMDIARALDMDTVEFEQKPRAAHFAEIQSQAVDDSLLRGLGWAPTVDFSDGIHRTIEWYRGRSAGDDASRAHVGIPNTDMAGVEFPK